MTNEPQRTSGGRLSFISSISLYESDRLPIFRSVSLIDLFTNTAAILN